MKRTECGNDAEAESGKERDSDSKTQDSRIRGEVHPERKIYGDEREQRGDACVGKENPKSAAGESEEKTFGDELTKKPAARGTESRTHGNLADACGSFDKEKIADVGARDKEKQCNRDQEGDDSFAIGTCDEITDRNGAGDPVVVDGGIFAVDLFEKRFKLARGLLKGDAGLEAGDSAKKIIGASGFRGIHLERDPKFRAIGKMETGRHDADNGRAVVIDLYGSAEDFWIAAVTALPEFFADDHNFRSVGEVVFARNGAAKQGIQA